MGLLGGITRFVEHVGSDAVNDGEHLWHTAVNATKTGLHAVATDVRTSDATNAKAMSWLDSGEQFVEGKIDQGRAWLRQHGGVAGKVASDYIGFEEGANQAVFDTAKGLVQLSYNVQQLENPLEWAANPGANIARLKSGFQAAVGLGKLANLTQPASWIADPVGNERMVSALWQTAEKNFEADPSKATGYVAGTIATFFIPGGGEEAAAGDTAKLAELGDDAGEIVDLAKANGIDPKTILGWRQSGMSANDIKDLLLNRGQIFTKLAKQYPTLDTDLLGYLLSIHPQGNYLTEKQIEETMSIIGRINGARASGQMELEENLLTAAIAKLRQANIPGTDKLIYDMFNGNYTSTDYLGSRFQLSWIDDHLGQIAKIEDFRPAGAKGADVVMKNGDLIDTKSLTNVKLPDLLKQIKTYARDFPNLRGHTLEFVLEKGPLKTSQQTVAMFSEELNQYARAEFGFSVTITTYP